MPSLSFLLRKWALLWACGAVRWAEMDCGETYTRPLFTEQTKQAEYFSQSSVMQTKSQWWNRNIALQQADTVWAGPLLIAVEDSEGPYYHAAPWVGMGRKGLDSTSSLFLLSSPHVTWWQTPRLAPGPMGCREKSLQNTESCSILYMWLLWTNEKLKPRKLQTG